MPGAAEAAPTSRAAPARTRASVEVSAGLEKSTDAGAAATTAGTLSGMSDLRVRVVTEHHRAPTGRRLVFDLVVGVLDRVEVRVGPLEVECACAVARIGVGTGSHPNGAHADVGQRSLAATVSESHRRIEVDPPMQRQYAGPMDVRSIEEVEPVVEHNGTVPVWWLVSPREMQEITAGGYLELVSEFEVAGGGEVDPHSHPTHEFYYVTSGRGFMTIDGRGPRDPAGRPRAHPAGRGAQPPPGVGPRADPLLLLRGRQWRMRARSTTRTTDPGGASGALDQVRRRGRTASTVVAPSRSAAKGRLLLGACPPGGEHVVDGCAGDHDDAVDVADDPVAGLDRDVAHGDRPRRPRRAAPSWRR